MFLERSVAPVAGDGRPAHLRLVRSAIVRPFTVRSRTSWILPAAVPLLMAGGPVAAQDDPDPRPVTQLDEQVTVTANREAVPLERVGSSVTVIGRDEIETRQQLHVSDYLRTVPGVEVIQNGGAGKVSTIRVRGGLPSQMLVLVDGVRINNVTGGEVDFAHLMADNLERIEVLRGPQATYGSEAMSGVINILTARGGEGWGGSLAVEAGSREHERVAGSLSGRLGLIDGSFSASDFSTESVSQIPGIEPDPYENTTITARLGTEFLGDGRIDLSVRDHSGDVALDGFGVEDLNSMAFNDGRQVSLAAQKNLTPRWRQTIRLSRADDDLEGVDPDSPFSNYLVESENTQVEAQADLALGVNHTLNVGYSGEGRDGFNRGSFEEQVDLDAVFIQDQWSPTDTLHVTGAVRRDDHEQFGDETSWRFTFAKSFAEGATKLHGSAGTAFRAPSFNELYFPFAGDPNLLPETSEGWDVGLEQSFLGGSLRFDLTFFDIEFENLIQFDLSTFAFGNVSSATSAGIEFTARYWQPSFGVAFSHTYNDTEDADTGLPLARRPEHRSTLTVRAAPFEGFDAALMVFDVRDRIDSTSLPMDDYTRVDVSLRYLVLDWLRPYARVENVLDEDYQEVPGFVTPGATFMVGLSIFR